LPFGSGFLGNWFAFVGPEVRWRKGQKQEEKKDEKNPDGQQRPRIELAQPPQLKEFNVKNTEAYSQSFKLDSKWGHENSHHFSTC
jgi:hypothetical protein